MPLMPTRMVSAHPPATPRSAADLVEPRLHRHAVERGERQRREDFDPPAQAGVELVQQRRAFDGAAGELRRVGQRPGSGHRQVAEVGADRALQRVAERDDEIHSRRVGAGELVPRLAAQAISVVAEGAQLRDHLGIRPGDGIGPGGPGTEPVAAEFLQDRLGHDRAGRVVRAQEQHVERRGHAWGLLGQWGKQARDVAAQFGTAAAAGLGQEAEQLPQPGEAHGMDDLPALAGGLRQAGALERGQMERRGGGRKAEPGHEISGRQPIGPLCHEQAQQVEPCIHRQSGEDGSSLR